ncbi:hypothetical protein [Luteimonas sp. TWI1416]|uniref:hypothetical protein n=1 Tax=unclassified Luteimonas TaxID=2629088 RepID=UPI00320B4CBF
MGRPPDVRAALRARARHGVAPLAYALAALYLLAGLWAMWRLAPRVPYADGWRYIAVLADARFVDGVLMVSNGHREVLPNMVRWLDLRLFGASQGLQILVGIGLLLATLAALWRPLATARPAVRAVAFLWAVVGLCWLGNARALVHAQESVHAYLVTLALALGVGLLAARPRNAAQAWCHGWLAGTCGLVATFSFGSGIACFGAFGAVLWLRRAAWRDAVPVLLCAGVAVGMTILAGVGGERIGVAPVVQADRLLRWLAAPSLYAAWPLLDPEMAARLPVAPVRSVAVAVSECIAAMAGSALTARWPHLLTGALGAAWLLVASLHCRRAPAVQVVVGLGIAWFALGVGVLIALARLEYFTLFPAQLLATRYVVWSSLFWAGLAYAAVAGARTAIGPFAALVVAALLLPSQLWMWRYAERIAQVATPIAASVAVGVLDPELTLGENVVEELRVAAGPLARRGAAMHAWPEVRWLGRAPGTDVVRENDVGTVTVAVFDDDLVPDRVAQRVTFAAPQEGLDRWLLLDADGVARGLALRDPLDRTRAIGWMQDASAASPRVATLRGDADR